MTRALIEKAATLGDTRFRSLTAKNRLLLETCLFLKPEHQIKALDGLSRGTFAEIV